jgi:hypothetical protein
MPVDCAVPCKKHWAVLGYRRHHSLLGVGMGCEAPCPLPFYEYARMCPQAACSCRCAVYICLLLIVRATCAMPEHMLGAAGRWLLRMQVLHSSTVPSASREWQS